MLYYNQVEMNYYVAACIGNKPHINDESPAMQTVF